MGIQMCVAFFLLKDLIEIRPTVCSVLLGFVPCTKKKLDQELSVDTFILYLCVSPDSKPSVIP